MTFCEVTQLLHKNDKVCRHSWPTFQYLCVGQDILFTVNDKGEHILFSPKLSDLKANDWRPYVV